MISYAESDQTPQNTASDQGRHCLITGISIRNIIKKEKLHHTPLLKIGNGLIQFIRMDRSTRQMWVEKKSRLKRFHPCNKFAANASSKFCIIGLFHKKIFLLS